MDLDPKVGTHASLCNTLSSNKPCPKTVKIVKVKGLIKKIYFVIFFLTRYGFDFANLKLKFQ